VSSSEQSDRTTDSYIFRAFTFCDNDKTSVSYDTTIHYRQEQSRKRPNDPRAVQVQSLV